MPPHELGKRDLASFVSISAKQFGVGAHGFYPLTSAQSESGQEKWLAGRKSDPEGGGSGAGLGLGAEAKPGQASLYSQGEKKRSTRDSAQCAGPGDADGKDG
jgi:hypothetical protein